MLRWIVIIGLAIWAYSYFGKYERRVDAYYYPDRHNLSEDISYRDIGSVEACRDWAYSTARRYDDPQMRRGTYECGVDPLREQDLPSVTIYRETVQ